MNERIRELAEQAGIEVFKVNGRDVFYFDAGWALDEIERFAELVRQDEREACAKLCEEKQSYSMPIPCPDGISGCCVSHYIEAKRMKSAEECAKAIRARSKHD